jgi:hypothetical protein
LPAVRNRRVCHFSVISSQGCATSADFRFRFWNWRSVNATVPLSGMQAAFSLLCVYPVLMLPVMLGLRRASQRGIP